MADAALTLTDDGRTRRTALDWRMLSRLTLGQVIASAIALVAVLFAIGWTTRQDPAEKPYLTILGGGFIANYRIADMHYGFTALVTRPLPTGSIIEARFEDPAGGPSILVSQRVGTDTERYTFRTPPLAGVEAGRRYAVDIRVYDRERNGELWRHELTYASQIDGAVIPDEALTVGPGYARPGGRPARVAE